MYNCGKLSTMLDTKVLVSWVAFWTTWSNDCKISVLAIRYSCFLDAVFGANEKNQIVPALLRLSGNTLTPHDNAFFLQRLQVCSQAITMFLKNLFTCKHWKPQYHAGLAHLYDFF